MEQSLRLQEAQVSRSKRLQSRQQSYKEFAMDIYEVPLTAIGHRQMCFAKFIKALLTSQIEMVIH